MREREREREIDRERERREKEKEKEERETEKERGSGSWPCSTVSKKSISSLSSYFCRLAPRHRMTETHHKLQPPHALVLVGCTSASEPQSGSTPDLTLESRLLH